MAATKTIRTKVTLHAPAKDFVPFEFDNNGAVTKGKYAVDAFPPGTPVTLDADEADAILARFGGEEVTDAAPAGDAASAGKGGRKSA